MRKTTVYLAESEADELRRMAAATKRSQADLIREGVRRVLGRSSHRRFHSLGKGASRGRSRGWSADEVYAKAFGRR